MTNYVTVDRIIGYINAESSGNFCRKVKKSSWYQDTVGAWKRGFPLTDRQLNSLIKTYNVFDRSAVLNGAG